jgi:hypothetical protein
VRKLVILGTLLLLPGSLSGCGGANADNLLKQEIEAMNSLAEALERNAPEAKVAECEQKLEDIDRRLEAIKLSMEESDKLFERHKEELTTAFYRLKKAGMSRTIKGLFRHFGLQLYPTGPERPPTPPKGE